MSRVYIYNLLRDDALSSAPESLGQLGFEADWVYAGDTDGPEGDRFLILRYGTATRGMGAVNRTNFVVWAYERNKDHDFVARVLKRVRDLLEGVEAARTEVGWITRIEWAGDGEDFYDDAYRAPGRNSGYQLIDSGR